MMAVLELPPRLACSMRVSLLSLKGTWLLPCTRPCYVMLTTISDYCDRDRQQQSEGHMAPAQHQGLSCSP